MNGRKPGQRGIADDHALSLMAKARLRPPSVPETGGRTVQIEERASDPGAPRQVRHPTTVAVLMSKAKLSTPLKVGTAERDIHPVSIVMKAFLVRRRPSLRRRQPRRSSR